MLSTGAVDNLIFFDKQAVIDSQRTQNAKIAVNFNLY
jgi:hypothetical protein